MEKRTLIKPDEVRQKTFQKHEDPTPFLEAVASDYDYLKIAYEKLGVEYRALKAKEDEFNRNNNLFISLNAQAQDTLDRAKAEATAIKEAAIEESQQRAHTIEADANMRATNLMNETNETARKVKETLEVDKQHILAEAKREAAAIIERAKVNAEKLNQHANDLEQAIKQHRPVLAGYCESLTALIEKEVENDQEKKPKAMNLLKSAVETLTGGQPEEKEEKAETPEPDVPDITKASSPIHLMVSRLTHDEMKDILKSGIDPSDHKGLERIEGLSEDECRTEIRGMYQI